MSDSQKQDVHPAPATGEIAAEGFAPTVVITKTDMRVGEYVGAEQPNGCTICGGLNWVCEQRASGPPHDHGWPHDDCAGPGDPCPGCNPLAAQ